MSLSVAILAVSWITQGKNSVFQSVSSWWLGHFLAHISIILLSKLISHLGIVWMCTTESCFFPLQSCVDGVQYAMNSGDFEKVRKPPPLWHVLPKGSWPLNWSFCLKPFELVSYSVLYMICCTLRTQNRKLTSSTLLSSLQVQRFFYVRQNDQGKMIKFNQSFNCFSNLVPAVAVSVGVPL